MARQYFLNRAVGVCRGGGGAATRRGAIAATALGCAHSLCIGGGWGLILGED